MAKVKSTMKRVTSWLWISWRHHKELEARVSALEARVFKLT